MAPSLPSPRPIDAHPRPLPALPNLHWLLSLSEWKLPLAWYPPVSGLPASHRVVPAAQVPMQHIGDPPPSTLNSTITCITNTKHLHQRGAVLKVQPSMRRCIGRYHRLTPQKILCLCLIVRPLPLVSSGAKGCSKDLARAASAPPQYRSSLNSLL